MKEKRFLEKTGCYQRISSIIDKAKGNIVHAVNYEMVKAYWMIGREIVLYEQKGEKRAGYGKRIIEELSRRLSIEHGQGWSPSHLWHLRQFYLMYKDHQSEILRTKRAESGKKGILHTLCPELSWSHYRLLMRVENVTARDFYEIESIKNNWSVRELERQKGSLLYERLALSKNKKAVMRMALRGQEIKKYDDIIKDPYVLEFTGLNPLPKLYENSLEQALMDNLSKFILELGRGFSFVARQKRITLEGDHFYVDLVFYNMILKCYVLIDLKVGKLTHQDIGQMQMYVHYYDREVRRPDDSPTVGLLLCEDKKEAIVKYTLSRENKQIFASKYRLYLPTKKELMEEMEKGKMRLRDVIT